MKSKQKILIAVVCCGVLTTLFLGGVLYPVFQGVLEDHKKVLEHKKELLQLVEDKKNSREFEMVGSQYVKELMQLENLFVDSETPIAFFRFLDETAASFRLRIEKVPGPTQRGEGDLWPSFDVRLAGGGLYPDFMAFLQKIENAPYLLEVKTLTLSTKKGSQGEQNQREIEFSLSVKVFTK